MVCVTALAEAAFPSGPPSLPSAGFEVGYVAEGGASRSVALAEAQALPFEHFLPVRRFAARKGQRHLSGLWWSATTGGHVGFESWLERDHLMLLDFDPQVTGISSQPFWLRWLDEGGKAVAHVPDFFARRADGSAVVVDCRPAERRKPADVEKFEATALACAQVGWDYRLAGAADPVVTSNVRWLAGYRHPRHCVPGIRGALQRAFAAPAPLMAGAEAAGHPVAVLPVLFHLLWRHELTAGLLVPLHPFTRVSAEAAAR
jgi:TnsA-like endonuclease N terminal